MRINLKKLFGKISHIIRNLRSIVYSGRLKSCGKNVKFLTGVKLHSAKNIQIGSNVRIGERSFLSAQGGIEIGNNVSIAQEVLIWSANHNYYSPEELPYDSVYIKKPVIIKDNVWIGARACIVPGIIIDEGAVIAMGAVVTSNIPKCAVAGENPAKIIKYRDIKKYEELKNNKAFKAI